MAALGGFEELNERKQRDPPKGIAKAPGNIGVVRFLPILFFPNLCVDVLNKVREES